MPSHDRPVTSCLYDRPEIYQAAFADRNIVREVDALVAWYVRASAGRRLRSVLELAAGPADHALEFARRGVRASALDVNAAMCQFAKRAARSRGLNLDVRRADIRVFRLPGKFDLAINMLDSLSHLHTLDDLNRHLRCVARCLHRWGVHVMELSHPADWLSSAKRTKRHWTARTAIGRTSVQWGGRHDTLDPLTQLVRTPVVVSVARNRRVQVI